MRSTRKESMRNILNRSIRNSRIRSSERFRFLTEYFSMLPVVQRVASSSRMRNPMDSGRSRILRRNQHSNMSSSPSQSHPSYLVGYSSIRPVPSLLRRMKESSLVHSQNIRISNSNQSCSDCLGVRGGQLGSRSGMVRITPKI